MFSLFLVNNGGDKMVSHISHSLPGQSSMTIIRYAPSGSQTSGPTLRSQPHPSSVTSHSAFSSKFSQPLIGQTPLPSGVQNNLSHGQMLHRHPNSTRHFPYSNQGMVDPGFSPSPQMIDSQHGVYSSFGSGSNYLIYPGGVPNHSHYTPVPDHHHNSAAPGLHQYPGAQDPPIHSSVQGPRQYPQDSAAKGPEYPLTEAPGEESVPGPFAPRFQVQKLEVEDEEAREEIVEGFTTSGLYPGKYTSIITYDK